MRLAVNAPETREMLWNSKRIWPYSSHWTWCQSKAHVWFSISH